MSILKKQFSTKSLPLFARHYLFGVKSQTYIIKVANSHPALKVTRTITFLNKKAIKID
jgi:hypothetical protein